ncbi:hypothetical protein [Metabacillus sp. 84]
MTKRNRKTKSGLQHAASITEMEFSKDAQTSQQAEKKSHPPAK